jgi:hypothetical protein
LYPSSGSNAAGDIGTDAELRISRLQDSAGGVIGMVIPTPPQLNVEHSAHTTKNRPKFLDIALKPRMFSILHTPILCGLADPAMASP